MDVVEYRKPLPLPRIKPWLSNIQPIATPTELSWFPHILYEVNKMESVGI
jgi:hypothetical protein